MDQSHQINRIPGAMAGSNQAKAVFRGAKACPAESLAQSQKLPCLAGLTVASDDRSFFRNLVRRALHRLSLLMIASCLLQLAAFSQLAAAEPELSRFAAQKPFMGVEFEAIVYAETKEQAQAAHEAAFRRVAELNQIFSDYDLSSEAMQWTASAPHAEPKSLSIDLATMLRASMQFHHQSEGAFDITIGPLTKIWRRARRQRELPTAEEITVARKSVGMQQIAVDPTAATGQLKQAGMRLDFGGLVKGYAAEEGLKAICKLGLTSALVRGSGDIALGSRPPGSNGWRVGIAPLDPDAEPSEFLTLENCCISTSGDARQHLIVADKRYSHIIDPRTGWPVEGRSSVTIVAPRGHLADGVATAVSVLGPQQGAKLCKQTGVTYGLFIFENEGRQSRTEFGQRP